MIDITTVNDPFTLQAEIPSAMPKSVNKSYLCIIVILLFLAGIIIFFYVKNKEETEDRRG